MRRPIVLFAIGAFGLPLAGCASNLVVLAIDPVVQTDAPVQIVSIRPSGDNVLATVTVKNATDRPVEDFTVAWSVFRPVNCAVNGPAPRLQHLMGEGRLTYAEVRYAEVRGSGTLPPGVTWGFRVFKPHEQTEITSLWLSREFLLKLARIANARKLRVQVGVSYADFPPEVGVTYHIGPDWRNVTFEQANNILDVEDAAQQACN